MNAAATNFARQPMPALHVIISPAFMAALTALELGACYRLAEVAWASEVPGVLLDEDSFLQSVCRTTSAEWQACRPAVLRALGSAPHAPAPGSPHDPACGAAGHLVLQAVRSAFDATHAHVAQRAAKAADLSAKRREAGRAGAQSRWQTDGKPMAIAIGLPSAAPSLRPVLNQVLSAPAPSPKPERAIQSAPDRDVCAVLGEGARALLAERVADWQRQKSLGMLQVAIAKWAAAGATTCPVAKAAELAAGQHATPARVEFLIEDANGKLAAARAERRGCNPVGIVISGLGLAAGRPRPVDVPLQVQARWDKTQAETLNILEAQAAINARVRSVQAQLGAMDMPQGGPVRRAVGVS